MTFKPGQKLYFVRDLYRVVTSFEDDGDTYVVLKKWLPRKRGWTYKVEMRVVVELCYKRKPERLS